MIHNKCSYEQEISIDGVDFMIEWIEYKCSREVYSGEYYVSIQNIEISVADDDAQEYVPLTPTQELINKIEAVITEDIDWNEFEESEREYYDELNFDNY